MKTDTDFLSCLDESKTMKPALIFSLMFSVILISISLVSNNIGPGLAYLIIVSAIMIILLFFNDLMALLFQAIIFFMSAVIASIFFDFISLGLIIFFIILGLVAMIMRIFYNHKAHFLSGGLQLIINLFIVLIVSIFM